MIYYPHYTPSKDRLRSTLLFCDQISLIVPGIDQTGVERRGHVSELIKIDDSLIDFKDPTFRYDRWMERDGVQDLTENLILELMIEIEEDGDLEPILTNEYGYVEPGQDDAISSRWAEKGWKYVAAEKFPQNFEDLFFRDGVALRAGHFRNPNTNEIIEHNGVLCHPKLADFVLSRMAREASLTEGIPSITFGGINYVNHLYDGAISAAPARFSLLQSTMDLLVPDNLSQLNAFDFLLVRDEYTQVRRSVWRYLEDISRQKNLDIEFDNQNVFFDRISDARSAISDELEAA